jgi:hypothetical protein
VTGTLSVGLLIPALLLGGLGWLVPRLLGRVWPEGVGPLLLLAFVATLILLALSTGVFLLLYLWEGAPLDMLLEPGIAPGLAHFVRLGLLSALLWAPVLVLSVANLPKHWVKETW